jgi:hypothetical protein
MLGFSPLSVVPLSTLWGLSTTGSVVVPVTGEVVTTELGDVTVYGDANTRPTGVQLNPALGVPFVTGDANVRIRGVFMFTYIGQSDALALQWIPVNDTQTGNWIDVRPKPRLYN